MSCQSTHSSSPEESGFGEIMPAYSGTFGADNQFFRELVCTALFHTDPANHLWGQTFIDH